VENKFYDELRKKADKSFDWGREKNPKKIAELISGCLADVKRIIEHKTLVGNLQSTILGNSTTKRNRE